MGLKINGYIGNNRIFFLLHFGEYHPTLTSLCTCPKAEKCTLKVYEVDDDCPDTKLLFGCEPPINT